jgi:starch synthase
VGFREVARLWLTSMARLVGRNAMERPLRALLINENVGGHATMHLAIDEAIRDLPGITATILDLPPAGPLRKAAGTPIPGLARRDADLQPLRNQLAQSLWVQRWLRGATSRFDVIHAYSQNTVLLSARCFRRIPTVVSTDATAAQYASMLPYRYPGPGTPTRVRLTRRFEDRIFDAATLVVAQSDWAAASLRDCYGVPEMKVRQIPFGISMHPPAARFEPDTPEITFIGKTLRRKGGFRVLDMYQTRLSDRCRLNVVTRDRLPALDGVRVFSDFVPGDERLRDLLARTAVFVFPSEVDTFGYAVVEAMAAGVPVVASASAALPEIVDDGVTGLLVPPRASDADFCSAIERLLADPGSRRSMGAAARRKAIAHYDAHDTTRRLVEVLYDAVDCFAARGAARRSA